MATKTKQATKLVGVTVPLQIPMRRIQDLLTSAFEGGSNYWYMIEKQHKPTRFDTRCMESGVFPHIDYPTNPGGWLDVSDGAEVGETKKRTARLDMGSIKRGLAVFTRAYPTHFGDFLSENDDATTGDAFLQCCLFGDVMYG